MADANSIATPTPPDTIEQFLDLRALAGAVRALLEDADRKLSHQREVSFSLDAGIRILSVLIEKADAFATEADVFEIELSHLQKA